MFKKTPPVVKRHNINLLFVIFLIAFVLRTYYLKDNAISFAYDQARDGFIAKEILSGDLKILGPSVSGVPGLYHGVLYYYFIAPFYAIGKGNPIIVAYAQSFISSLGIFIAYFFCFFITKKKKPSIIAALIFAFSFEASQYANLLSNPVMATWFVPLTYMGLYLWVFGKSRFGSIMTGLFLGLAVQSEIALFYHVIPIAIWLVVYRRSARIWDVSKSFFAFLLAIITMLATELKFGFKGVSGVIYLFTQQDGVSKGRSFVEIFIIYFNQVREVFSNNILPIPYIGGVVGVVIILAAFLLRPLKNDKQFPWQFFLISAIAPQIFALPFGGTNMRHIMVGASVGIAVFTAIFLHKVFAKSGFILSSLVILIITTNLFRILSDNQYGQTIFTLQKDLVLEKELAVIDYTYKTADGSLFSINTVTSPLWVNTLWSYLYNWKGIDQYGYLPGWTGKNQIGQPGNNLTPPTSLGLSFLIIEPTYGIPEKFIKETVYEEDSKTQILEEVSFGDIIVQKRRARN